MAPLAWPLSAVASSSTRLERRDDIWPTPVALHNDAADAPAISIVPAAQDDHAAESEPAVTTVVVAPAPVQPAPPAGGDAEHYLSTYQTPVATVVTTDVFGQLATSTIYAQVTATVTGVAPPPKSTSNADGGAIAGGVIGIILFLPLCLLFYRYCMRKTVAADAKAAQEKSKGDFTWWPMDRYLPSYSNNEADVSDADKEKARRRADRQEEKEKRVREAAALKAARAAK